MFSLKLYYRLILQIKERHTYRTLMKTFEHVHQGYCKLITLVV